MDKKYADYVFFPLLGVLKDHQKLPTRALESALQCIYILLKTGWRLEMDPKIALQLLIFFTVLTDSEDGQKKKIQVSEELLTHSFQCMQGIFSSLGKTQQGRATLTDTASIPFIGKSISVILNGASSGASTGIQLAALRALDSFCVSMPDREALAISFLPGIVSCMTKVLTPNTQARRNFRQFEVAYGLLNEVFAQVLSDEATAQLPESAKPKGEAATGLTKAWLSATAGQVKIALSQIIKLRQHERPEVRRALSRLCVTVLEKCRKSLSESAPMMLETLVTALSVDQDITIEVAVRHLLNENMEIANLLRNSLRQWTISLPRIMQGHDDTPKRRTILQISTAFQMLADNGIDTSMVKDTLTSGLRDSVASIVLDAQKAKTEVRSSQAVSSDLVSTAHIQPSMEFDEVLMNHKSQEETVKSVQQLLDQLSKTHHSLLNVDELVTGLYSSRNENDKLASFWLALNYLRTIQNRQGTLEDFMDAILLTDNSSTISNEELLEELYSFSLSVLTEPETSEGKDWRIQALCLETLSLQAEQQKQDFRVELVEALYPVVHLVGSSNSVLREHAIISLNIIAKSCGYAHVGDLIVSNVDYLVNAVALKLNTFDISPQAPLVLLMMVKLTGPSLLPYLDDLVDSIFAALDNYHGYPLLVELLFKVLKGIAEEGAKAPQLAITMGESNPHEKPFFEPISIHSLAEKLKVSKIQRQRREKEENDRNEAMATFLDKDEEHSSNQSQREGDEEGSHELAESPPPLPKTYGLLLNISRLTQHYLTAASPTLRNSLLGLLRTSLPALGKHEESFLPLINTIWPVLVSRLDDPEPYVVVGALDVIGLLCIHAGDFMRGRIESLWPHIISIYSARADTTRKSVTSSTQFRSVLEGQHRTIENVVQSALVTRSQGDSYSNSPIRLIRDGVHRLISAIVKHTAIDETTYDQMLELVAPVLEHLPDLKEAMEARNPDAVWLTMLRIMQNRPVGHHSIAPTNVATGTPVRPAGKPGWTFSELVI